MNQLRLIETTPADDEGDLLTPLEVLRELLACLYRNKLMHRLPVPIELKRQMVELDADFEKIEAELKPSWRRAA
ncbi:MAG: hypothetical protein HOP19_01535 [Acidobacteria bacterium]|nr:hypothetical protein [Acidobacteriota bacterium]